MNKKKKEEKHPIIESVVLTEEEILTAPTGCRGFVAEVGPEEAQTIIEHSKNFRDVLPTRIKMYATDMAAGKWGLNEADNIVIWRYPSSGGWDARNGNHRMHAIIKSGTRQQFMVVVTDHEPHDPLFDGGSGRTLAQFFKNRTGEPDRRASSLSLELLKQQHVHRSVVSRDMALAGYRQYKDGIDYVVHTAAPRQKMGLTVPIFLAMVRGYYNTDNPDRLREFAEAVEFQKYSGPKDDGARLLNVQRALGKAGNSASFYLKCERAVSMFINEKSEGSRSSLKPASFPGHLLAVPPYSGPGAQEIRETVVPETTGKVFRNSGPFRVRQLLIANEGVAYTTLSLARLYKTTFGEEINPRTLGSIMRKLCSEPNFTEPHIKNKRENAIRYYTK